MVIDGDMVRGQGNLMRVVATFQEWARCVWLDDHGVVRTKWFDQASLMPLSIAIGARSLWPESGNLDVLEIEREEREAAAAKRAERSTAKKARRSNKIKRKVAA